MTLGTRKADSRLDAVLALIPNAPDRETVLRISQQYRLDPDDPAFILLLLSAQGIESLDQAAARVEYASQSAYERAQKTADQAVREASAKVAATVGNEVVKEISHRIDGHGARWAAIGVIGTVVGLLMSFVLGMKVADSLNGKNVVVAQAKEAECVAKLENQPATIKKK